MGEQSCIPTSYVSYVRVYIKGPFVDFLKSTEVGGREGARERELEWQRRSDQAGEDLHEG